MSGIVKSVKKVVSGVANVVKKVAPIAIPLASLALPGVGTVIGGTLGSIISAGSKALSVFSAFNSLTGGDKEKAVKESGAVIAAQRRQEVLLKQQAAAIDREKAAADKREEELDGQVAAQKNAILARRRGRGGLSFSGPQTGLKNTLGG